MSTWKRLDKEWPPLSGLCSESGYNSKEVLIKIDHPDYYIHDRYMGVFFSNNYKGATLVYAKFCESYTAEFEDDEGLGMHDFYWKEIDHD